MLIESLIFVAILSGKKSKQFYRMNGVCVLTLIVRAKSVARADCVQRSFFPRLLICNRQIVYGSYFGVYGSTCWLFVHKDIILAFPRSWPLSWNLDCQGWSLGSGVQLYLTNRHTVRRDENLYIGNKYELTFFMQLFVEINIVHSSKWLAVKNKV